MEVCSCYVRKPRNAIYACVARFTYWYMGVIGQKELVKTAVVVEISMATAVISFLKEDTGWTKRVGENACNS